jgi:hypothetical protein
MKIRSATQNDLAAIAAVQAASRQDAYRVILPDDYLDSEVTADLVRHRVAGQFHQPLGGIAVEKAMRSLCGHHLFNLKVVWSDLSVVTGART